METTEMVARVVVEARRRARADSEVDEQAWFDAGEPDTEPMVLRLAPDDARGGRPRSWLLVAAGIAIAAAGYWLGYWLAQP